MSGRSSGLPSVLLASPPFRSVSPCPSLLEESWQGCGRPCRRCGAAPSLLWSSLEEGAAHTLAKLPLWPIVFPNQVPPVTVTTCLVADVCWKGQLVCMCVYMCTCVCVDILARMCVCVYVCARTCVRRCTCMRVCVCVCEPTCGWSHSSCASQMAPPPPPVLMEKPRNLLPPPDPQACITMLEVFPCRVGCGTPGPRFQMTQTSRVQWGKNGRGEEASQI